MCVCCNEWQVCFGVGGVVQCRRFWGAVLAAVETIFSGVTERNISVVCGACCVHPLLLLRGQVCRCRVDDLLVYHARHDQWVALSPGIHAGSSRIFGMFDQYISSHTLRNLSTVGVRATSSPQHFLILHEF